MGLYSNTVILSLMDTSKQRTAPNSGPFLGNKQYTFHKTNPLNKGQHFSDQECPVI